MTPELMERIEKAIRGIRFGQVQIIVHEGEIVQIERTEKVRLERSSRKPTGLPEATGTIGEAT